VLADAAATDGALLNSAVTLTGYVATAGKLVLKGGTNPGLLMVNSDSMGSNVTITGIITLRPNAGSDETDATVTGTGIVLNAADSDVGTTAALVGSIGIGTNPTANDATISGPLMDEKVSAIGKGWKAKMTT
jgi:hypothetical protein